MTIDKHPPESKTNHKKKEELKNKKLQQALVANIKRRKANQK